jgi:hypothetical protein
MERSIRQVNLPAMKNRPERRAVLVVSALVFLLLAVPVRARQQRVSADYLLVEHAERLLVYNRYQQRITPEERKLLTPFVPMKILDAETKLNDDFTPCLKAEIGGNVYYLIKNDAHELVGKNSLGMTHVFKDVTALDDTVRLISLKTTLVSPDQKKTRKLQKGKILTRYFREKKRTFVRCAGPRPEYGWVNLTDKPDQKEYVVVSPKKDAGSDLPLSEAVQKRICLKLNEANAVLKDLFLYFNAERNEKKDAPQWRFAALDRQYSCILEPAEYAERYSESARYLAGDIDNILIGTNYNAAGSPGEIDIRLK